MSKLPVKQAVSAGGVVLRHGDHGFEVLLVGRTSLSIWSLPKGTPQKGERLEMTAVREVGEETGLRVEIVAPVGKIRYWFTRVAEGFRYDKTVHFYAMRPVGGDISAHDWEHDEVRWFPDAEALRLLTYPNEVVIVRCAIALATRPEMGSSADPSREEHHAA